MCEVLYNKEMDMCEEYESVVKQMGNKYPVMNIIVDIGAKNNHPVVRELKECSVICKIGTSNVTITEIKE